MRDAKDEKHPVVVFGEDFGRHPHCLEHLARCFPATLPILWVETAGMRAPRLTWSDMKRSWQKIRGWFQPSQTTLAGVHRDIPANVHLIRPFSLPWWGNPLIRRLNRSSIRKAVRQALQNFATPPLAVITSLPTTGDFVGVFGERTSIYYCVDEFKLWPNYPTATIERMEAELLKADRVLCTSRALLASRSRHNPHCELFTHGVDVKLFRIAAPDNGEGKTIFGYYGLLDERCDQTILSALAGALPESEIHIWGNVVVDISALRAHENIVFHGEVAYRELANAIRNVCCFILPYRINAITRTIYPLKIKEYLVTGRPIVVTHLPDMDSLLPHVTIAEDTMAFVEQCRRIAEGKQFYREEQVEYFATREDWSHKAQQLLSIISAPRGSVSSALTRGSRSRPLPMG